MTPPSREFFSEFADPGDLFDRQLRIRARFCLKANKRLRICVPQFEPPARKPETDSVKAISYALVPVTRPFRCRPATADRT